MAIDARIFKAVMLLDHGRVTEAEVTLREALLYSELVGDEANLVRTCTILGELLYSTERDQEAIPFLRRAVSTARDDDVLDYEINRASEILHDIERRTESLTHSTPEEND